MHDRYDLDLLNAGAGQEDQGGGGDAQEGGGGLREDPMKCSNKKD